MSRRDTLPGRVLSALVTLAMVASLIPTPALAEMTGAGTGGQDVTEAEATTEATPTEGDAEVEEAPEEAEGDESKAGEEQEATSEDDANAPPEDEAEADQEAAEEEAEDEAEKEAEEEADSEEDAEEKAEKDAEEKAEEEAEKDASPAIEYSTTTEDGLKVEVSAPEGAFPEGTEVVVKPVTAQQAEQVKEAANEVVEGEVAEVLAADISFVKDGTELEPADGHQVGVRLEAQAGSEVEGDEHVAVHVDDAGQAEVVDENATEKEAEFEADQFSVYAIVSTRTDAVKRVEITFKNGDAEVSKQTVHEGDRLKSPDATPTEADKTGYTWKVGDTNLTNEKYFDVKLTAEQFAALQALDTDGVDKESDGSEVYRLTATVEWATGYRVYLRQGAIGTTLSSNVATTLKTDSAGKVDLSKVDPDTFEAVVENAKLAGWTSEDGTVKCGKDDELTVSEDTTLYPVLQAGKWITLDTGTEDDGSAVAAVGKVFGAVNEDDGTKYDVNLADVAAVSPKDGHRPGYTFGGWYTEADGAGTQVVAADGTYTGTTHTLAGDATLHAKWEAKTDTPFTIVHMVEGPEGGPGDGIYTRYASISNSTTKGTTGTAIPDTAWNTYSIPYYHLLGSGEKHTTAPDASNSTEVKVKGDGTAVKYVYWNRNRVRPVFTNAGGNRPPGADYNMPLLQYTGAISTYTDGYVKWGMEYDDYDPSHIMYQNTTKDEELESATLPIQRTYFEFYGISNSFILFNFKEMTGPEGDVYLSCDFPQTPLADGATGQIQWPNPVKARNRAQYNYYYESVDGTGLSATCSGTKKSFVAQPDSYILYGDRDTSTASPYAYWIENTWSIGKYDNVGDNARFKRWAYSYETVGNVDSLALLNAPTGVPVLRGVGKPDDSGKYIINVFMARLSYKLSFAEYDGVVDKTAPSDQGAVFYDAPLSSYDPNFEEGTTLRKKGGVTYEFAGWFSDLAAAQDPEASASDAFKVDMTSATMTDHDLTLYAGWVPAEYTVTFESNGGTAVDSQQVDSGEKATEPSPAPTKTEGSTSSSFAGWYADKALTKPWDFTTDVVTEDTTLYAKWVTGATYTVTYHHKDGTAIEGALKYFSGATVTLDPVPEADKTSDDNKPFMGWSTEADADKRNSSVLGRTLTIYESKDLYPAYGNVSYNDGDGPSVWLRANYPAKVDLDDEAVGSKLTTARMGESVRLPTPSATSEYRLKNTPGYTFLAWNSKADGTGERYEAEEYVAVASDTILYAMWEQADDNLAYDANGGEGTVDATEGRTYEDVTVAANAFTRSGYHFAGWNTAADGSGDAYEAGGAYALTVEDDVLYAQWEQNSLAADDVEAVTYDGSAQEPRPRVTNHDGATLTKNRDYTLSYENNTDAGTATVTVTGAGEYAGCDAVTKEFTIKKAPLTVTAADAGVTYGEAAPSGGVTYEPADYVAASVTGTPALDFGGYAQGSPAGSYAITPSGLASDNYQITYVPGTLTVDKRTVGLTWAADLAYDGTEQHYAGVTKVTGTYNDEVLSVASYTGATSGTDVGSYKVTATSLSGDRAANYRIDPAAETTTHTWKIEKAENAWTTPPSIADWTYGHAASTPKATAKFGTPTFEYKKAYPADSEYSADVPTEAGSYVMRATVEGTDDYEALASEVEFSIAKAQVTVKADDKSSRLGDPIAELTFSVSGDLRDGDTLDVKCTTTATSGSAAGPYPITCDWKTENANYQATFDKGIYSVTAGDLEVSAEGYAATYDAKTHSITVTVSKPEDAGKYTVYYSDECELTADNFSTAGKTANPAYADAGEHTVWYYVDGGNDYGAVAGSEQVSIAKAPLTVTLAGDTTTYGDEYENPLFGRVTAGEGQLQGGDSIGDVGTPSATCSYERGDPAGTYPATPKIDEGDRGEKYGNYEITYVPGTLTVQRREVGLTWAADLVYDGTEQHYAGVTAVTGAYGNDSLSVASYTGDTSGTDVGSYNVTATSLSGTNAASYRLPDDASHTWNIGATPNSWASEPAIEGWTYGHAASAPRAAAKFGEPTFEYKAKGAEDSEYTADVPTAAGDYVMRASVPEAADKSYAALEGTCEFTIAKAKVTVTADDKYSMHGKELSPLTHAVTGDLKSGDTLDVRCETEATSDSAVGNYDITCGWATENTNYDATFVKGTYTIGTADLSVSAKGYDGTYDGKAHGITVAVSDPADATQYTVYYSETEPTEESKGSTEPLTYTKVGEYTVWYYVDGGTNYGHLSGSKKVSIAKRPLTVTATDKGCTYGEEAELEVAYDGFAEGEDERGREYAPECAYEVGDDAGDYDIVPTIASDAAYSNYDVTTKAGTLTVSQREVGLDWAADLRYTGEAQYYAGATATGALEGDSVSVGTYAGSVSGTDVGEYEATASSLTGPAAKNYRLPSEASHTWKIEKAANEWTREPAIAGWKYGSEASAPVAASKFGTPTFEYKAKGAEDSEYSAAAPTEAGSYVMRATVAETSDYAALSAEVEFSVSRAQVTVYAHDKSSKFATPLELVELTHSVAGELADETDITVELTTTAADATKVGEYPIVPKVTVADGKQADYDVRVVNGTYTLTTGDLQVSAEGYAGTYDAQDHSITVTVSKPEDASKYKVYYSDKEELTAENFSAAGSTDNPQISAAGDHTVWYYVDGGEEFGTVAGSKQVTIDKAPLTVTAQDVTVTYGDDAPEAYESTDEGLQGEDKLEQVGTLTLSCDYAKGSPAGAYEIGCALTEGDKYANYDVTLVPGTLTVQKLEVGLEWADDLTYDGTELHYDGASLTGTVEGDDVRVGSYSGTTSATDAGEYQASVTGLAGDKAANYALPAETSHAWKIEKAANEWTAGPTIDGWTYGKEASKPVATARYGEPTIEYKATGDAEYTTEVPTTAGSYVMRATVDETENHEGLSAEVEFAIAKAKVSVVPHDKSSKVGDPIVELTYTISGDLASEGDVTVTFDPEGISNDRVGMQRIIPIVGYAEGMRDNYEVVASNGTYTITSGDLQVTAAGFAGPYDAASHSITVEVSKPDDPSRYTIWYSDGVALDESNYSTQGSTDKPEYVDSGERKVYYYVDGGEDYGSVRGYKLVTIQQIPLTVTAKDTTITYGDALPDKGELVTYSGFVGGEDSSVLSGELSVECDYPDKTFAAGTYALTPGGYDSSKGNYEITYVPGRLTVEKKEIGLEWTTPDSFAFDGAAKDYAGAKVTGALEGDDVEVGAYTGASILRATHVGTYDATASALKGEKASSYELPSAASHKWTIAKSPLTVTANGATVTYGDDAADAGVTYGPADFATASVTGTVSYDFGGYEAGSDAGTYVITPSGLSSDDYEIAYATGTLTVAKARQDAPDAPVVANASKTSVSVVAEDGLEYSSDGGQSWVTDDDADHRVSFAGMGIGDEFQIVARRVADKNHEPSEPSDPTSLTKNSDGTYTDGRRTYVPVDDDGDGTPDELASPATKNEDGTYEAGDRTLLPKDTDGDGTPDSYVPVTPDDEKGTYTDGKGDTYLPVDGNGDGKPETTTGPAEPNPDGTHTDADGQDYLPEDTDGDGKPDAWQPGTKNDDGTYTGADGKTYIPADTDGDGEGDSIVGPVEKVEGQEDVYEDEDGQSWAPAEGSDPKAWEPAIPTGEDGSEYLHPVTANDDGTFTHKDADGTETTYAPKDTDGDGKADTYVPVTGDEAEPGTLRDDRGDTYLKVDTDGDRQADTTAGPATRNDDGTYVAPDGEGGDQTYAPVDADGDGTTDVFQPAIPTGEDSEGKTTYTHPVSRNDDGTYTHKADDGTETTYAPKDTDGDGKADTYVPVTENEDGTYTDGDDENYVPVDTDNDGKADTTVSPATKNADGTYTDDEDNVYLPEDTDGDGETDVYQPGTKNDDGTYTGADDKTYIPADTDGDGEGDSIVGPVEPVEGKEDVYKDEDGQSWAPAEGSDPKAFEPAIPTGSNGEECTHPVSKNDDGTYTYEGVDGTETTYAPKDLDGDGEPDTYMPVTKSDDGTYADYDDNAYLPVDTDGDEQADKTVGPATKNPDGTYAGKDEDGNDQTYAPVEGSDPKVFQPAIPTGTDKDGNTTYTKPVTRNDDGTYTDTRGQAYAPKDTDGDGQADTYVPVSKDDGAGTYTDGKGIYIPVDSDDDGEADKTLGPATGNGDGTYEATDTDGQKKNFAPADRDGDGKPEAFVDVTKDEESGTYRHNDDTYIPVDANRDGDPEKTVGPATANEDGTYEDAGGKTYLPVDAEGSAGKDKPTAFVPVERDEKTGTYKGGDDTYLPIDSDGDDKADDVAGPVTDNGDGTYKDEKTGIDYAPVGDGTWATAVVVTFDANGGTGTMAVQRIALGRSAQLTANAFTRDNHSFVRWCVSADGKGTPLADKESVSPTADITLYAQWQANTHTVSFESNGGSAVAAQTVEHGKTATSKTPTRTGHTFVGWYSDPELTKAYDFESEVTADITLYAKWKINTYTVTFKSNGGSAVAAQKVQHGKTATKRVPTREGHTFVGWYTDSELTKAYDFKTKVTGNVTLYAKWKTVTVTVTYKANGGTGTMAAQKVSWGKTLTLRANAYKRTGYTLRGWNTKADGKGKSYSDKAKVTLKADLTLYAQWAKTPTLSCTAHVQGIGDVSGKSGGNVGTTGQSRRLEAMTLRLNNDSGYKGSVQYNVHMQNIGWAKDWPSDGALAGTRGESRRVEALRVRLTGELAEHYDVWYRTHCQTYGWTGWAKNGAPSGSTGGSKRMECYQITILPKGSKAPGTTVNAFYGGL